MQKQNKNCISNLKFQGRFEGKINQIPKQGIIDLLIKKNISQNIHKQKINTERTTKQNNQKSFKLELTENQSTNPQFSQNHKKIKKSRSHLFQRQKAGKQTQLSARFQSLTKQKLHDLHLPAIRKSNNTAAQIQRNERYFPDFQLTKRKLTAPTLDFLYKNKFSKQSQKNETNQVEQYLKVLNHFESKLKDLSARSNVSIQKTDIQKIKKGKKSQLK